MKAIELIRKLVEYDTEAEVEFQFIPNGELRVELDDVEIDGTTVIIPQHGIMLAYQNIIWYSSSGPVVINLRPKYSEP